MCRSAIFSSFNKCMLLLMYQIPRYTHGEEKLRLISRWITILVGDGATTWTSSVSRMRGGVSVAHNLSDNLLVRTYVGTYVADGTCVIRSIEIVRPG